MWETKKLADLKTVPNGFGRVGVFLGGRSRERTISLRSGEAIYEALIGAGVDALKIDTGKEYRPLLKRNPVDVAFLALHGKGGEDGKIQRVLERLRIPYVGSDAKGSLMAFDKARAKSLFQNSGIPTPKYSIVTVRNWKKAVRDWAPPFVIKPTEEGSSIGVDFIERKGDAARKVVAGLKRYPRLIIEEKIMGREFTVGILGDEALPVIELRPKRKFYDFKAKYTKGMTDYLIPAPIDEMLAQELQEHALQAHRALGLRDMSRVDFIVDEDRGPFVLEVNSIPGFTETSLLPKAARHRGIDFTALCLCLLQFAAKRKNRI